MPSERASTTAAATGTTTQAAKVPTRTTTPRALPRAAPDSTNSPSTPSQATTTASGDGVSSQPKNPMLELTKRSSLSTAMTTTPVSLVWGGTGLPGSVRKGLAYRSQAEAAAQAATQPPSHARDAARRKTSLQDERSPTKARAAATASAQSGDKGLASKSTTSENPKVLTEEEVTSPGGAVARAMAAAHALTALEISRPFGLRTEARYSAIGVTASPKPAAKRGAARQRANEATAKASMAADSAPDRTRAA